LQGVRHRSLPITGVQFHPESILTVEGKALLANFLS
jgi:anthranilate synthase component 2